MLVKRQLMMKRDLFEGWEFLCYCKLLYLG